MRRHIFPILLAIAAMIWSVSAVLAAPPETVTICHAAGLEGTTQFVELTLPYNAVYGQAGHFNEDGTPQAGHEDDYIGPCILEEPTSTSTTSSSTSTTLPQTTSTASSNTTTAPTTTTMAQPTTTTTSLQGFTTTSTTSTSEATTTTQAPSTTAPMTTSSTLPLTGIGDPLVPFALTGTGLLMLGLSLLLSVGRRSK